MKSNKNILILSVSDNLSPRVRLEKEALEECGYTVHVLYRAPISWKAKVILGLIGYYATILKICIKSKAWAVHLTHISQIPICPILKFMNKIVVYDAYERYSVDITELHFYGILKTPVRWIIEFYENLIIRFFVDAVFTVSTPSEYLLQRYKKHCRFSVCLYNVPSLRNVFCSKIDEKFSTNFLNIAYIGGIWNQKGSGRFIPLAKLLAEKGIPFEMHIIGPFDDKIEKSYMIKEAETHNLLKKIHIHGYMDYISMLDLLYKCHIGLNLTSTNKRLSLIGKGSSRKNFTYMASGMVVLTSDVGEIAYVTKKNQCGYVIINPDDIESIALVIERLFSDKKLSVSFACNGLYTIKNCYNWELEKNKLINVYAKL